MRADSSLKARPSIQEASTRRHGCAIGYPQFLLHCVQIYANNFTLVDNSPAGHNHLSQMGSAGARNPHTNTKSHTHTNITRRARHLDNFSNVINQADLKPALFQAGRDMG